MIFTTLTFGIFLAILLPAYWALRSDRWRHPLLFAANFLFYGWWDWRFTGLLLLVVVISHWGSSAIARTTGRQKLWALYLACGFQLLVLGAFKYANFFAGSVRAALGGLGWDPGWTTLNIILPVGISFYIFQAISYLVSVYRGTVGREPSFLRLGVYLGFFPHLVAGPIIHAGTFLPQLAEKRIFDRTLFLEGWKKFAMGFLYKAVFADNIAAPVDRIFANPAAATPLETLGASIGFSAQIYFDFAGYSLMAIGIANLFGYLLPDNFRHPYRATSVIEFWRRWHISLSTWLRDYVYIPLGGNRGSTGMVYRNLMITMFLGGLWHGASWNFVVWGCVHGLALCCNHAWQSTRTAAFWQGNPAVAVASWILTQSVVMLCWIPFRAPTFEQTAVMLTKLGELATGAAGAAAGFPWILAIVPLAADHFLVGSGRIQEKLAIRSNVAFAVGVTVVILLGILFMHIGYSPFIYFQF